MKKKKRDLLAPASKCCLKKYLDIDFISKYGSLLAILSIFLLQIYNLSIGYNFYTSLFSFFVNGFFLFAVLVKTEFISFEKIQPYLNIILKEPPISGVCNYFDNVIKFNQDGTTSICPFINKKISLEEMTLLREKITENINNMHYNECKKCNHFSIINNGINN